MKTPTTSLRHSHREWRQFVFDNTGKMYFHQLLKRIKLRSIRIQPKTKAGRPQAAASKEYSLGERD